MEKVYVYKEHHDEDAYGEEIIEVYAQEKDAKARLKERVEEEYNLSFAEIRKEIAGEDDTVSDTYVSIHDGDGTVFWIVEEKEIF